MKVIKLFFIIIISNVFLNTSYAQQDYLWDDLMQDSIQIKEPIRYIGTYNKYSVINPNVKIMLVDFGNRDNEKNGIRYTLKKYGVQILNKNKVYNVLKTAVSLNSDVDFALLYYDENIVAFRVKEISIVDYVRIPFRRVYVSVVLYNLKHNNFIQIPVILSDSEDETQQTDLLFGDQVFYNEKKNTYHYYADIKYYRRGKIIPFKTTLSHDLECISSTLGCDMMGVSPAEKQEN